MSDEYNGWTNRETWAVKLLWDNNEGDYLMFMELAKEYKTGEHDNEWPFGADPPLTDGWRSSKLADALKAEAEEIYDRVFNPEDHGGEPTKGALSFVNEVGSPWRVNWDEIAKAYFSEVEES